MIRPSFGDVDAHSELGSVFFHSGALKAAPNAEQDAHKFDYEEPSKLARHLQKLVREMDTVISAQSHLFEGIVAKAAIFHGVDSAGRSAAVGGSVNELNVNVAVGGESLNEPNGILAQLSSLRNDVTDAHKDLLHAIRTCRPQTCDEEIKDNEIKELCLPGDQGEQAMTLNDLRACSIEAAGGLKIERGGTTDTVIDENPDNDEMLKMEAAEELFDAEMPDTFFFRIVKDVLFWWIHVKEPPRSGCLAVFVAHNLHTASALVVCMNAIFSAYVADWEVDHVGERLPWLARFLEWAFLLFYVMEICLRLIVHRLYFFCNKEYRWNVFDFLIVFISIYDQGLSLLGSLGFTKTTGSSFAFMRILRLLKIGKALRLFRVVEFIRDLRLMVFAIQRSFSSFVWSICLLSFILYIFSLILLQGAALRLAADDSGTREAERIREYFGSMQASAMSLYMATTGGQDWGYFYYVALDIGDIYGALFVFYTAFFTFTVSNILTGMIVENVAAMSQGDDDNLTLEYRRRREFLNREIQRIFFALDTEGQGHIGAFEFEQGLATDSVQALLNEIDLEIHDAKWFFNLLLSLSDSATVDIEHFVDMCMKMKGTAMAMDLQCLGFEVKSMRRKISAMHDSMLGVSTVNGAGLNSCGFQRMWSVKDDVTASSIPGLFRQLSVRQR